jgi:hypothetical protein
MSDLTDRLRAKGGVGCQCGAWYYGECCCSNAEWPEQFINQAADVLDAIDKLHSKVYGQAGPLPYCESCGGDTHLWPCPTHRLLHPEEGEQ